MVSFVRSGTTAGTETMSDEGGAKALTVGGSAELIGLLEDTMGGRGTMANRAPSGSFLLPFT